MQRAARSNPHAPRQTAVDFQDKLHTIAAINHALIEGDRIFMHAQNNTIWPCKNHVQRDQGIGHPKLRALGLGIDKQHARAGRHFRAIHQPLGAQSLCIGDFDRKCLPARRRCHADAVCRAISRDCPNALRKGRGRAKSGAEKDHRDKVASQAKTCTAILPRLPSVTRKHTASPACKSAKPEWFNTSI